MGILDKFLEPPPDDWIIEEEHSLPSIEPLDIPIDPNCRPCPSCLSPLWWLDPYGTYHCCQCERPPTPGFVVSVWSVLLRGFDGDRKLYGWRRWPFMRWNYTDWKTSTFESIEDQERAIQVWRAECPPLIREPEDGSLSCMESNLF